MAPSSDTKQVVATEMKRWMRGELRNKLDSIPGVEVRQIDTADSLEGYIIVRDAGGTRSFKVKVSEVS